MKGHRSSKIIPRSRIIELISQGNAIVIYKKYVLNLTSWLPKHPGGEKAVHHMIGRDATDEMNAYHSTEAINVFKNWKIGEIDYYWENLLPPIQGATYTKAVQQSGSLLEVKLDDLLTEGSEAELNSSASSINSLEFENKGLGYPGGKVEATIPQNMLVLESNKEDLFPVKSDVIIDPHLLIQNYDNKLAQQDVLKMPALDYNTQQYLRDKYSDLHEILIKNGFYKCNYWSYFRELVKISSLLLFSFSFLKLSYYKISAILLGMAWQQMTFIAHDAGHVSITHNYQIDNLFGMLISCWIGGLSLGWWKRNHNVHHLITNDPVHDPDIQHLPFFAVSVRLLEDVYSTYYEKYLPLDAVARLMIPIQEYLYYPILCFGRFNLYRLSWMHLIEGKGPRQGKAAWFRYFEIAGLSFFMWWFFYLIVYKTIEGPWEKLWYVMISHIATMLVHVQITLSHFAMSTSDLGVSESFPQRQIRTTMDVDCPEWLDFLHGGLQFQAIHHLFPRMPRHNLRRVQPFVIDFCRDVGLHYSIYGFGQGNEIVLSKLEDIAKQCSIMLEATKKLKEHDH
ncbi:uncharacterized protein PRCAT00005664001 [Priceomyces carsonii]|uniref:uncharacterized protein n=1 Tax=Priceomyces carsonii TaxID=28549 RepID=UPI002EDA01B1|nr:unnamed protein product [Priceomyces carsonii]